MVRVPRRRLRLLAVAVAVGAAMLASCSLFVDDVASGGVDPLPEAGSEPFDAAPAPSAPVEAAVEAAVVPCRLDEPFAGIRPLNELNNSAYEVRPTLTDDELIIVYTQSGYGVQEAHRTDRSQSFGQPVGILPPNLVAAISGDGLTLYYADAPPDGGSTTDLFVAHRAALTGAWASGVQVPSASADVNTAANERDPYPFVAGLVFASDRGGNSDLYEATLDDGGTVTEVHALAGAEVNLTPGSEFAPVMSRDGLRIYFGSDRPFGKGGDDIWTAVRPSKSDPFGKAINVEELNGDRGESPGWISPDGCRIYFTSDRPGGVSAADLWMAEKPLADAAPP